MATSVQNLPAYLNQSVVITPESTNALCSKVGSSANFTKPPAKIGAPAPKSPTALSPLRSVSVSPVDILQTLGLAMLPPKHVEQHLATTHWALVRYAYLIAASPGRHFATNDLAGDYKFHHMTALSEAFGVGCALSYAQAWLKAEVPGAQIHDPVDFDYLLDPGAPAVPGQVTASAAPSATRQPDYLIAAERASRDVRLLIVECKGNSGSGRSVSVGQLGSAMHQLQGVSFTAASGRRFALDRHAYAARVTKTGGPIEILAADPPEEGDSWIRPEMPSRDDRRPIGERTEAGELVLPSPEEVSGRLLRRLDDRTFAWAGAGDFVSERDLAAAPREPSEFGDVAGTTSTMTMVDGQRIKIFTGALLEALEAARDPDPDRGRETRMKIGREISSRGRPDRDSSAQSGGTEMPRAQDESRVRRPTSPLQPDEDPERVASAISEDGLALRIEVG